jgi:tyrosinase
MQTTKVHGTGSFFAWHRHLVWLYETALREECGYSGYQPYWDWSKYAEKPLSANPLIDGSKTSMSGNGRYISGRNGTLQPFPIPVDNPPALYCPPGTGGGYVYSGPFANWSLHLGPVVNNVVRNGQKVNPNPRKDGLGYNPRRLIRDFNNTLLRDNTYSLVTNMLTNMTSKPACPKCLTWS